MVFIRRKDELDHSSSEKLLASNNKRGMFGRSKKERSDDIVGESSSKSFRLFSRRSSTKAPSPAAIAMAAVNSGERSFHEEMEKMTRLPTPPPCPTPLSVSVITTTRSDGGPYYNKASDDVSTLTDLSALGAAANKRLLEEEINDSSQHEKDTTKPKKPTPASPTTKTPVNAKKSLAQKLLDASTPETQPEEEDDTYTAAYTQGTYGADTFTSVTSPSISTRVVESCQFAGILSSLDQICYVEQNDDATTTTGKLQRRRPPVEESSLMSQSKTTTTEWGTVPSGSLDDPEEASLDTAESDTLFTDLTTTTGGKSPLSASFEDKHENFELVLDEYQLEQAKAAALAAAAAGDDRSGPNLRSKVRNWMRKREDDKRTMEKEAKQEKYRAIFGTDPATVTKVETTTNSGEPIPEPQHGPSKPLSDATPKKQNTLGSGPKPSSLSNQLQQQQKDVLSPETVPSDAAVLDGNNNRLQTYQEEKKEETDDAVDLRDIPPALRVTSSTWEQRKIELERKLTSPTTVPSSSYSSAVEDRTEPQSDASASKFEKDAIQASKKRSKKSKKPSYKPTWKAAKDPKSGRYYYYHRLTRTTTWTKPPGYDQEQAKIAALEQQYQEQQLDSSTKSSNSRKLSRALSLTKRNKGSMSAEQQKKIDAGEALRTPAAAPKILKKRSVRASGPVPNKKKQEEISNILRTMSPPNESAITSLMQQYEGREDELLCQLKSMKVEEAKQQKVRGSQQQGGVDGVISLEAKGSPFDEPTEQREAPPPVFSMLDTAMSSFGVLPASAVMGPGSVVSGSSRTASPSPSDATSLARTRTGVTIKTDKTERTDKTDGDKTAKVDNTRRGGKGSNANNKSFDAVTEPSAADTSISSVEMIDRYEIKSPGRPEAERTRELRVEEFSSKHDSISSEKYAGKILRPSQRAAQRRQQEQQRKQKERAEQAAKQQKQEEKKELTAEPQQQQQRQIAYNQSDASERGYMVSSEEDEMTGAETGGEDDISALSDTDLEYFEQKERLDRANRKALSTAIRNKDWDTAASVTNTLRAQPLLEGGQPTRDRHAFVPQKTLVREWTQADLDKSMARSDWNAVAKYIAVMKENSVKKQQNQQRQNKPPVPPIRPRSSGIVQPPFIHRGRQVATGARVHSSVASAARNNPRFKKRFGARSQLQRDLESVQSSSWESDSSYDDDEDELISEDETSASESEADLRRFASRRQSKSLRRSITSSSSFSSRRRQQQQQKFQC